MKRTMLIVPVLALLIMPCGSFAQQENVANAQTANVGQGTIMIADNDVIKETTTTEKEKRKHHHGDYDEQKTTTTIEKPAIDEKRTTTTIERPAVEESQTKTKTTTETKY